MRFRGFTLVELLVVITIVVVLASLSVPAVNRGLAYARRTKCLSNMRQVGIGLNLYSQDNNNTVPRRASGTGAEATDRWPAALDPYIQDASVYIDPEDPESAASDHKQLVSNDGNRTAFLMNGFNDLGAYTNSDFLLNLARVKNPSDTILLGQKQTKSRQYYMDFVEGPNGNQNDVLNKTNFSDGANYVFADGSARYMKASEYKDTMWVISADYTIPTVGSGGH